jgi:hypothetical protein
MATNYNQQILALVAAASIDLAGLTPIAYGCSMTRIACGIYKVILPTGNGVVDGQSFTRVTPLNPSTGTGVVIVVSDESNEIKTISVWDTAGSQASCQLEVKVERAVASQS